VLSPVYLTSKVTETSQAFATALTTYFLIKVTPAWGLALLFTTAVYFIPLVYISNKELIDGHLDNASTIINQQTQQVRDLASQHTSKAAEITSSTFKEYSARAQEALGQAKGKAVEKGVLSPETANKAEDTLKSAPSAPTTEPVVPEAAQAEPKPAEPVAAQ
jgi:hypothetical protein